jgi:hypothetical protein
MKGVLSSLFAASFVVALLSGCGSGNNKGNQPNSGVDKANVQIKDDTLKGFMLAGVYFVQGYGGADKFESKLKSLINQDRSQSPFLTLLDSAYHKTMVFPFGRSAGEKVDSRNTLSNWFQIANQHDFFLFLNNLKDSGFQAHYEACRKVLDANGGKNANISSINLQTNNLPEGSDILLKFVKDNYDKFSPAGIKAWNIGLYVYIVNLGYSAEYIDPINAKSLVIEQLKTAQEKYNDWSTYFSDFMLGREFSGVEKSQNEVYKAAIKGMLSGHYSMYTYMPM